MDKNFKTLELDSVLNMLASECTCADAADYALSLSPCGDMSQAQLLLNQTEDAFSLFARFVAPVDDVS